MDTYRNHKIALSSGVFLYISFIAIDWIMDKKTDYNNISLLCFLVALSRFISLENNGMKTKITNLEYEINKLKGEINDK